MHNTFFLNWQFFCSHNWRKVILCLNFFTKSTSSSSSSIADEYWILCPHALTKCVLTWNSNGKLFWFNGQKPPTQLIVTAVCRANQSDGAFPTGRLVIKRHLFIGQDVIIVWRNSQSGEGGIKEKSLIKMQKSFLPRQQLLCNCDH